MIPAETVKLGKGAVGHIDQHEAEQKAEAVRQHIGEVSAVENVVKLADDKAHGEKYQQECAVDLFPQGYFFAAEIQHGQRKNHHAAVDIGQTLHGGGGDHGAQIGEDLAHGIQNAEEGGFLAHVDGEFGGEAVDGGRGALQPQIGRNGQQRRHTDGQQGEKGDAEEPAPEAAALFPVADTLADKDQQHKNAGEQADVIAHEDGQCQRGRVQNVLALPQQPQRAQHHQRQNGHRIQPDGVPVVAHEKSAQGIGRGEEGHRPLLAVKEAAQHYGEKQSGAADAHQHGQGIKRQQPGLRQQCRQEIKGTGQIIGHERQVVGAHAARPGEQQGIAVLQLPVQIQIEGIILVPLVVRQNHLIAKGPDPVERPQNPYNEKGDKKRQQIDTARLGVLCQTACRFVQQPIEPLHCFNLFSPKWGNTPVQKRKYQDCFL